MKGGRSIGFAVPAWRSEAFIGETLRSALGQRGVEVRIFVGVDGACPDTIEACRAIRDPRIGMRVRKHRLGWLENGSRTLHEAATSGVDYVALLPHDDVLSADYALRLIAEIERHPGTAAVYSDIACFGGFTGMLFQPSALGDRIARLERLLRHQMGAVSIRGVMPTDAMLEALPFKPNRADNFAADSVWMLRQAAVGELRRLAEPLYHKRYHGGNTHDRWLRWNRRRRFDAFFVHCEDCLRTALPFARNRAEHERLVEAARARLERFRPPGALSEEERRRLDCAAAAMGGTIDSGPRAEPLLEAL